MLLQEGKGELWRQHVQDAQTVLYEVMAAAPALDTHRLRRGTKTEACLTVLPSTMNRMEMGYQEWSDAPRPSSSL